jgi:two-component system nitrate/nitrite response regulator NarL
MKVVLVGPPAARAKLRAGLEASGFELVGEVPTLGMARELEADAYVVAAREPETEPGEIHPEPLTPRELQVLELLAEGLANRAIAARLGISDQTVKFHVASVCGKLGAANRTEAVRRAVRRGLLAL